MSGRPYPLNARALSVAFLDARTAGGVMLDGRVLPGLVKRGAGVVHFLRVALAAGADRVYLVGDKPAARDWLFVSPDGWEHGAHYLDRKGLDAGRFRHASGHAVELLQAASWFGWGGYTPREAAAAYVALARIHERTWGTGARLLGSPAGTATDAWLRTMPDELPPTLDDETQELIRDTACQHHVELGRAMPAELPGFVYLDGRFMFANLTRELGVGPVVRDTLDTIDSHTRARFLVDVRVPADWEFVGMLPHKLGPETWEWPAEPGRRFRTWVDGSEARLARAWGWDLSVVERLAFTTGRPLDRWTAKLVRAREAASADELGAQVAGLVRGALRAMLVQGIGAFHSTGQDTTELTAEPFAAGWSGHRQVAPGLYAREVARPLTGRYAAFRHPEWSAAVWGRSHTRVLSHRGTGLLHVPPAWLVGVRGDALYLSVDPEWDDDGAIGRLRVKGRLDGPVPAPRTLTELNKLRQRAEKAGNA